MLARHVLFGLLALALPAAADPAEILDARMQRAGGGWAVSVTLAHADTGWDDYADGWRVELADGTVLGTRTLFHPHVDEQPFTRSLTGVEIPSGIEAIFIRARTSVTGWGAERHAVALD